MWKSSKARLQSGQRFAYVLGVGVAFSEPPKRFPKVIAYHDVPIGERLVSDICEARPLHRVLDGRKGDLEGDLLDGGFYLDLYGCRETVAVLYGVGVELRHIGAHEPMDLDSDRVCLVFFLQYGFDVDGLNAAELGLHLRELEQRMSSSLCSRVKRISFRRFQR